MTNSEFLKKYQRLQYGIMFDELFYLESAIVGISHTDKTTFWNYALIQKNITEEKLAEIESKMKLLERAPIIYVENGDDFSATVDLLNEKGYGKAYEDSWMFWEGGEIDSARFSQIKKVFNEDELKIYLETFDNCFRNNDPQNPYGELGDYLKVAEKSWHDHHASDKLEYFIAYKENEPVAVATLANGGGLGYISNVGSLKKVRGEGFGKLVTLFCVEASKKKGNETHFLATEENTYPNEFYKQIGFETRFTAVAYAKNIL